MAFSSLFTLLDDIASMLDDVALMTKVAAKKTAGVVGDDLALNANQLTGVRAERELPIVWAVAKGSLINKAVLIPLALLLSVYAPFLIVPLLLVGGGYLCFEGAEKLLHRLLHRRSGSPHALPDTVESEADKIKGAVRTDFILSAEIVIIALEPLQQASTTGKIIGLTAVGIGLTAAVYGIVALIVKADDFGAWLAARGGAAKWAGRAILAVMPLFLRSLSVIGTLAMFVVGGGIYNHYTALHHIRWGSTAAALTADLLVGLAVGLLACALVLPLVSFASSLKKH